MLKMQSSYLLTEVVSTSLLCKVDRSESVGNVEKDRNKYRSGDVRKAVSGEMVLRKRGRIGGGCSHFSNTAGFVHQMLPLNKLAGTLDMLPHSTNDSRNAVSADLH